MKIGLVGKVNVGKSTLFNRLLGNYRAIVTDIAGTTREIIIDNYNHLNGKIAELMDSPGLEKFSDEVVYIEKIINQSDILVFIVDGKNGTSSLDDEIYNIIIKFGKKNKTILAVNKIDGKNDLQKFENYLGDYYKYGFDAIVPIAAKNGDGIDTIKEKIDKIAKKNKLKFENIDNKQEEFIKIAIVGRPNVGKSTLINKFFGDTISRVNEKLGTTLDYMTCDIKYKDKDIKLYDTAGIRRKGRILGLERIAFEKTIKMLEYVKPIIIFMVDIKQGVTHTDLTLLGEFLKLNLPIVIAFNKSDEIEKRVFDRTFKQNISFFEFAKRIPIIPISSQTGYGLDKLLDYIIDVNSTLNTRISTGQINKALGDARVKNPPKFTKNKVCKYYYASQIQTNPPKFLFFINKQDNLNFAFKKWLENVIRKNFGFIGVPINFEFREKQKSHEFRNNDEI